MEWTEGLEWVEPAREEALYPAYGWYPLEAETGIEEELPEEPPVMEKSPLLAVIGLLMGSPLRTMEGVMLRWRRMGPGPPAAALSSMPGGYNPA